MSRPPNADGQRTRQAILDAALALFAEKGYFGTSLRDVASAIGVRESALYNYFPGKEALFEALLTEESATKTELLSALLEHPGDSRDRLERLAEFVLNRFVQPRQQQLFRILMSDGMRLARDGRINLLERMGSRRQELLTLMRRLVADGFLRDEDPELLVMAFLGPLLFWRQLHALDATPASVQDRRAFARAHVHQFLNGAAAEPAVSVPARGTRRTTAS